METRFEAANDFGRWIKSKGKTVAETAKLLGVTRNYVHLLATGKALPSAEMMAKIQGITFGDVTANSWMPAARQRA